MSFTNVYIGDEQDLTLYKGNLDNKYQAYQDKILQENLAAIGV